MLRRIDAVDGNCAAADVNCDDASGGIMVGRLNGAKSCTALCDGGSTFALSSEASELITLACAWWSAEFGDFSTFASRVCLAKFQSLLRLLVWAGFSSTERRTARSAFFTQPRSIEVLAEK